MYIREKTVKGNKYAYLVRSVWSREEKKSTQKTIMYLGRVERLEHIDVTHLEDEERDAVSTYIQKKLPEVRIQMMMERKEPDKELFCSAKDGKCNRAKSKASKYCKFCMRRIRFFEEMNIPEGTFITKHHI